MSDKSVGEIEAELEEPNKGGRPRKEIDLDELSKLVELQCTAEECAGFFEVSVDTIDRRLKEAGYDGFADYYKNHADAGKISLRRAQWKSALGGNVAMQIWLGKQHLDQRDKNELTGKDGGPLQNVTQVELVAASHDNSEDRTTA